LKRFPEGSKKIPIFDASTFQNIQIVADVFGVIRRNVLFRNQKAKTFACLVVFGVSSLVVNPNAFCVHNSKKRNEQGINFAASQSSKITTNSHNLIVNNNYGETTKSGFEMWCSTLANVFDPDSSAPTKNLSISSKEKTAAFFFLWVLFSFFMKRLVA
jgi:hypothetical protein